MQLIGNCCSQYNSSVHIPADRVHVCTCMYVCQCMYVRTYVVSSLIWSAPSDRQNGAPCMCMCISSSFVCIQHPLKSMCVLLPEHIEMLRTVTHVLMYVFRT